MECIRRVKRGKQKEIRPEDLLIDFNNQEDNVASKPLVSNKSTGNKSSTHKKYEDYGIAGPSGLTHNEKATPVVIVDDDEDNELHKLHKSEKKKKKENKKNKKPQNKRKRSTSRSSRSSRSSSEENNKSGFTGAPRKVSYLHTVDLSKDMREALRVTKLVYFVSFLFTDFTNYHE